MHKVQQHSKAQHSTAQHSTAQRSAAQRSTAQHSTSLLSIAQAAGGCTSKAFQSAQKPVSLLGSAMALACT